MNIFHLTFTLTLFLVLPDQRESCPCLQSSVYLGNFLVYNLPELKYDTPLAMGNNQLPFHKTTSDLKKQTQHANKPLKSTSTSPPKSKLTSTISTMPPTTQSTTLSTIVSSLLPSTALFPTQTIIPSTIQSIEPVITPGTTVASVNSSALLESPSSFYQDLMNQLFDKNATKEPPLPLTTQTAIPSTTQSMFPLTTSETILPSNNAPKMPEESPLSFYQDLMNQLFDENTTKEPPSPSTTPLLTQTTIPTTTKSAVSLIIKPEESSQSFYEDLLKGLFNPNTTKQSLTTRSTTQSVASFASPEDTLLSDIPSEMPQESSKSFFSDLFHNLVDPAATKQPPSDWGSSWVQPSQSDSYINSNPNINQYMNDPMQFDQEFSNYPDNSFVNQPSPFNSNFDNQYPIGDSLNYPPPNNQYSSYYGYPQVYPEMMPPQYP